MQLLIATQQQYYELQIAIIYQQNNPIETGSYQNNIQQQWQQAASTKLHPRVPARQQYCILGSIILIPWTSAAVRDAFVTCCHPAAF